MKTEISGRPRPDREPLEELPSRVDFAFTCPSCPGDGVVRGARAGVDWPTACACGAKRSVSTYQIARAIKVDPRVLVRVFFLRARADTCERVLEKLARSQFAKEALS